MALFIRQTEDRSKLQERLAAELQERAKHTQPLAEGDKLEDQSYLKDTKTTSRHAWLWAVLVVVIIVTIIIVTLRVSQ